MNDSIPESPNPCPDDDETLPLFATPEEPGTTPPSTSPATEAEAEAEATASEPTPTAKEESPDQAPSRPTPPETTQETPEAATTAQTPRRTVTPAERARILEVHDASGIGTRAIAKAVGRDRKTVQRVLREEGRLGARPRESEPPSVPPSEPVSAPATSESSKASKLDPFRGEIDDRIAKGLTVTRILREVRQLGYEGGRTILANYVRQARAPLAPRRKVTRRFETPMGEEMQVDWSTYRVTIGGTLTVVHVLAVVLAHSRRSFLWATDSQRLERLLEGLTLALEYFEGVSLKIVFDNMAQVSLGRVGSDRKPIWNERFLPYVSHYGFEPALCQIAHPDRKGEVEALLGYFERDCLRGLEPDCLAELNRAIFGWNDGVANKRVHGTTGRVPDEVWEEERDFLIPLPERRYAGVCVEEMRRVAEDCTVSILGTPYTVPARLAHRQVRVRLYTEHFEVLDRDGAVAFTRSYVPPREKGRLQLVPEHFDDLPYRRPEGPPGTARRLEDELLERWPALEGFLAGLKRRMPTLVHVHVRRLFLLGNQFGDEALSEAAQRADGAGLHNWHAVKRILEADYDELDDDPDDPPFDAEVRVDALLGDVESGSLDDYGHLDDYPAANDDSSADDDSNADDGWDEEGRHAS